MSGPTRGERYAGNISWLERARTDKPGVDLMADRHVVDPAFDQDSYDLTSFMGLSIRLEMAEEARG